jgi:hypothetical protein
LAHRWHTVGSPVAHRTANKASICSMSERRHQTIRCAPDSHCSPSGTRWLHTVGTKLAGRTVRHEQRLAVSRWLHTVVTMLAHRWHIVSAPLAHNWLIGLSGVPPEQQSSFQRLVELGPIYTSPNQPFEGVAAHATYQGI